MSLNFLMPVNLLLAGVFMANVDYTRLFEGHIVPILVFLTGLPYIFILLIILNTQLYPDQLSPEPVASFLRALFFISDATTSVLLQALYVIRLQAFFQQRRHIKLLYLFCVIPCLYVVGSGISSYPSPSMTMETAFVIYATSNMLLAVNSLIMHTFLMIFLWRKCDERNIVGFRRLEIFIPLITVIFYFSFSVWTIVQPEIGYGAVALSWVFEMLALPRIHVFMQSYIFKESMPSNVSSFDPSKRKMSVFVMHGSHTSQG